tara:strand:+ start:1901 stop:2140 length:240 start_codon:yes stop_codon:yes gene_type:complete
MKFFGGDILDYKALLKEAWYLNNQLSDLQFQLAETTTAVCVCNGVTNDELARIEKGIETMNTQNDTQNIKLIIEEDVTL